MRSDPCQCLQHNHEHLVVHSELLLVHEGLELLVSSDKDLSNTTSGVRMRGRTDRQTDEYVSHIYTSFLVTVAMMVPKLSMVSILTDLQAKLRLGRASRVTCTSGK